MFHHLVKCPFPDRRRWPFAFSFALILWFLNKQSKGIFLQLFIFRNILGLTPGAPVCKVHQAAVLWLNKVEKRGPYTLKTLARNPQAHVKASAPVAPACPRDGVTVWFTVGSPAGTGGLSPLLSS